MKKALIAGAVASFAILAAMPKANAETFFQVETGLGASVINDMGDGVWIQRGAVDNNETTKTPALLFGFTGEAWRASRWDVRWHLDYTYIGSFSASVLGVPDDQYDAVHHRIHDYQGERLSPFNGQGHLQGVSLTADVGYTYNGWRFGAEAGPWVFWQTWHESLYDLANQWDNLSHKTVPQLDFVVGASVSRGPFSLSYRYYHAAQKWNPYPGLATGAHVLMAKYTF